MVASLTQCVASVRRLLTPSSAALDLPVNRRGHLVRACVRVCLGVQRSLEREQQREHAIDSPKSHRTKQSLRSGSGGSSGRAGVGSGVPVGTVQASTRPVSSREIVTKETLKDAAIAAVKRGTCGLNACVYSF